MDLAPRHGRFTRASDLEIETHEVEAVTVLEIRGELDLSSAPGLCAQVDSVRQRRAPRLLIDLSRLEFCDSTGLRALVGAAREIRINGGRLLIVPPAERAAARVFDISGAGEFLPLATDPALATAALQR